MANLLWAIVAILVILWFLGLVGFHIGSLIWAVLVIAVVLAVLNLLTGRRLAR